MGLIVSRDRNDSKEVLFWESVICCLCLVLAYLIRVTTYLLAQLLKTLETAAVDSLPFVLSVVWYRAFEHITFGQQGV